jgi:energy-converting hydrogenase A subunit M
MVTKERKFHEALPLHSRNRLDHRLHYDLGRDLVSPLAKPLYIPVQEVLASVFQTVLYQ